MPWIVTDKMIETAQNAHRELAVEYGFYSMEAMRAALEAIKADIECDCMRKAETQMLNALKTAIAIAELARQEWDAAPDGMRAGKLLIALAGGCPGYRADIDAIHAVIAAAEGKTS